VADWDIVSETPIAAPQQPQKTAPSVTMETAPQQQPAQGASPYPGLDPDLLPILHRESRGNANIGFGGTDLTNAPKDETGFPIWDGAMGPEGKSHAAGLFQIQPGTWKPIAQKLGIHDFSVESQIRVANELKKEEGLKPWAASEPKGNEWAVTSNGKWKVSPDSLASAQSKPNSDVVWMSPDDYLSMTPETEQKPRHSLRKMLEQGDEVQDIPTLDVETQGERAKIVDQDGRQRALVAKQEGVDLIPVSIHGISGDQPAWIEGMRGTIRPFNFMPVPKQETPPTIAERFGTGVRDVIGGGAQLLSHAVPSSIERAINHLNNYLADEGVPLARIPEGGIDQMEREREQNIEAQRKARGETGTDLVREAGRVAAAIPAVAAAAPYIPGTGVANALATGAASGGIQGALEPVTGPGNFLAQKLGQVGEGAALGAGTGVAANAAANLIKPAFRPAADLLMKEGVRLTPGQMAGGVARRVEDALSSIPVLGQAVRAGARRAILDFNRAAWNRVLAPLGEKLPKNIQPGRDAAEYVDQAISRAYNAVVPHLTGQADRQFLKDLVPIFQRAKNELPPEQRRRFAEIFNNQLVGKTLSPKTGEQLKGIDSMLGAEARGYRADPSYDNRKLGQIIGDLHAAFRAALTRQNPKYAPGLKAANEAYANFVRVGRAAAASGAHEGVFSPAQLRSAVRQSDPTLRKLGFAKGDALMQDLSDAAESVLPRTVPDSGTPERLMTERAAALAAGGGAAMFEPTALAGALASSAPYTSVGMSALRNWAMALPKVRNALAQPIRRTLPYIAGAAASAPSPVNGAIANPQAGQ